MRDDIVETHDDEISLLDLFAIIWKKKVVIIIFSLIAAAGSVIYSLSLPNLYTAKATVLPISSSSSSSLSQYAGLAQMAGISLPGTSSSDPVAKIEAILRSRSLAERVIDELDLVPLLLEKPEKIKEPETPRGATLEFFMKEVYSVSVDDTTGLISVNVKTENPVLSRDISNKLLQLLETTLNEKAMTVSKKNSLILNVQLAEQEAKVKELQKTLADYQKSTKMLTPEGQLTQTMALYASLVQTKISTEIELSRLESALSDSNPKISALRSQLAAVEKQIAAIEGTEQANSSSLSLADTPDALIEYQNIVADLEIALKIYATLAATVENARLQESDDQLFVEIIDPAIAPEKKSEPSRAMICVVGTMAGFFLGILVAFILNAWVKLRPELKKKLSEETI